MEKFFFPFALGGALLLAAAPASSQTSGSVTGCVSGKPSVLVRVAGFKRASGRIKLSLYGPNGARWLAKGGKVASVKVPVSGRTMDICLPAPSAGRYAVAVHHDYNVNGRRDRADGGGYSRNPKVSLVNPKPAFAQASFPVGNGPARVGVTLLYIRGLSVRPVEG